MNLPGSRGRSIGSRTALLVTMAMLAACRAPAGPIDTPADTPADASASRPSDCRPQTQRIDGLSIGSTECRRATGVWRVRAEPELPGLALWRDGDRLGTVLQLFTKPADAGIAAILPTLRSRGFIPDDDDCRFVPARIRAFPRTIATFEIRPTGERLRRLAATPADQIPDPPCGPMGWSTHGVRYFVTDLRRPDRVVYIDEGQDGTQIDPGSLRWDDGAHAPPASRATAR